MHFFCLLISFFVSVGMAKFNNNHQNFSLKPFFDYCHANSNCEIFGVIKKINIVNSSNCNSI